MRMLLVDLKSICFVFNDWALQPDTCLNNAGMQLLVNLRTITL